MVPMPYMGRLGDVIATSTIRSFPLSLGEAEERASADDGLRSSAPSVAHHVLVSNGKSKRGAFAGASRIDGETAERLVVHTSPYGLGEPQGND